MAAAKNPHNQRGPCLLSRSVTVAIALRGSSAGPASTRSTDA
jgi:hypothetical protein